MIVLNKEYLRIGFNVLIFEMSCKLGFLNFVFKF